MRTRALRGVYSFLLVAWMVSFVGGGAASSGNTGIAAQWGEFHKVIAPPGLLPEGIPGVSLWHDYGAFGLYRVSPEALAALPEEVRSQVAAGETEMDRLLFDAYPFNTRTEAQAMEAEVAGRWPETGNFRVLGGRAALQVVQFVGPVKDEWLAELEAEGIHPVHYIRNNGYLVWADSAGRSRLSDLAHQADFLQYSEPYLPYLKLGASLRDVSGRKGDELVPVTIQMYRHTDRDASEAMIKRLSRQVLAGWSSVLDYQNIVVLLRASDIAAVASLPDVTWVGERFPRQLFDERQGQILAAQFNPDRSGPSGPGYLEFLDRLGFSQNPDDYPIVDVVDDGIGTGSVISGDPTFHLFGNAANVTRLAYVQNCTTEADGGGVDGHGHLNASIAAGYDTRSGSPYQDAAGYTLGLGINPYGRIAGTRVFSPVSYNTSRCGNNDQGVIRASYTAGARISTNSWGCGFPYCSSSYDDSSQAYDAGTRDALPGSPGNQEQIFIFAAGNDGPTDGSVGSPGNAKNVITVGASENYRPSGTDGCDTGTAGADDAMDIANFSSRGPAPGGRTKPEIVAPGTHVQGTASTNGSFSGAGVCGGPSNDGIFPPADAYYPAGQSIYTWSSGTSHSTPAVAGVASLYYYWLEHHYNLQSPSAALIKAYLIAHPTYLNGAGANDTLPSNRQGYGMPDLKVAFDSTPRYLLNQSVLLDKTGSTWTYHAGAADPSKPVRIVLAYSDAPGLIGSSPQVNNLDLKVSTGAVTYLGNHFGGAWSTSGGLADSSNNYEAVFLQAGVGSALDITVTSANIAGDGVPGNGDSTDQDFALVCYNCAAGVDFTLAARPTSQSICAPASAAYTVEVGQVMGFTSQVNLSVSGQPAGAVTSFSATGVTPPGISVFTVENTSAAAPGRYTLQIRGEAGSQAHTTDVGLELFTALPGAYGLLAPAGGATGQPLRPAFAWSAEQGQTYEIQIAADSDFTHIVDQAFGLAYPVYTPAANLENNTQYYWRVRADNQCGAGPYSAAATFFTVPLPGDCPSGIPPVDLYSENFESGVLSWSHGGYNDTWTLSGARTHSGMNALWTSDPGENSDQYILSPSIALPAGQQTLSLRFWNWQEMESYPPDGCYDAGILEISKDNGLNWKQVPAEALLTDPYDGVVYPNFGNPLAAQPAWCGDPHDWAMSIVDLSAYAGQTVRFRYHFGSDNSLGREGWYIDDVSVQGCSAPTYTATLGPDSRIEIVPGESALHLFTLQNLGLTDDYTLTLTGGDWPTELVTASPVHLEAGSRATVAVKVNVPVQVLHSANVTDLFTLTAASQGKPEQVLSVTGLTDATVHVSVSVFPAKQKHIVRPGVTSIYHFTITNTGNFTDTFKLQTSFVWPSLLSPAAVILRPGESQQMAVTVNVPVGATEGMQDTLRLTITSSLDGTVRTVGRATTLVGWNRVRLPMVIR